MEKKSWFYIAIACLAVSIGSFFFSVVTYLTESGIRYTYSLFDLIGDSSDFEANVLAQYKGPVLWYITGALTAVLAVIAIAGVVCAIIGLITLRAQRPNTRQFVLTIAGLIAVAFPSVVLIVCILGFGQYFDGTIGFGIAPVVTPIAMIVCIAVVIRRKNRAAEQLKKELESKGMIWKAGDLN